MCFFKGMLLGCLIAAPVGPIGVLCIRRTLAYGRFSGFLSGMGAAFADTLYALIAAFGMAYLSDFLLAGRIWLHLIGGAFLLYLGGRTFFAQPVEQGQNMKRSSLFHDFFSTFFLTLTNPLTILSFVAIFAGLGLSELSGDCWNAIALAGGVFLGSALWWLVLSEGVTLFRKKASHKVMIWINRLAGLLISAFGLVIWLSFAMHYM